MHNLNQQLFFTVNNLANKSIFFDNFFIFLTNTGFKIILIAVVFYLFFILPLKKNNSLEKLKLWGQATLITISTFVTWGVVWVIKVMISAPRPFEVLSGTKLLVEETVKTSFPSNHAAISFALATSVYFYHKKLGIFLFIIAILVSLSRMYVGVHFPIDIIAGSIIGILISYGITRFFRTKKS